MIILIYEINFIMIYFFLKLIFNNNKMKKIYIDINKKCINGSCIDDYDTYSDYEEILILHCYKCKKKIKKT